jgi:DNA-binding transcriptional LysR family regulator
VETIVLRDTSHALDVRLLLAFDALMSTRNVTQAASRLGLTQQGLSGQISRLRTLFCDPLFVRCGAGVTPTPRAEDLHPRIRKTLEGLEQLVEAPSFNASLIDGVVTIAASDYAMALLLPPLLNQLRSRAPKLKLAVRPANSMTLASELRDRSVDLAFTVPQFIPSGLCTRPIFNERYKGAVRHDHPLAQGPVTLDGFCAYPHLLVSPNRSDFHGPTDEALHAVGRKRDIAIVVPSFSVVAAMLESTDLLAVLPERLLDQTRRKLHVFETPVPVKGFSLESYWPERIDQDPMHQWFRALCFEALGV